MMSTQTNAIPLGPLFREAHVVIDRALYERLAELGFGDIRSGHGCVFGHLEANGSTITEIAARARFAKPTVVAAVDDLERLGYVERHPDPADRRAKIVRLTPAGRRANEAAIEVFAEIESEWAERIGEREMGRLRGGLEHLHRELMSEID